MKKIIFLLILSGYLNASGLKFLYDDVGGRSGAMAGIGIMSDQNAFALFWNPALISGLNGPQAGLSQALWLEGTNNSFIGVVLPGDKWKFGLSVNYSEIDEIDVRNIPSISPLGKTSWTDWYVGLSLSRLFKEKYGLGVTYKKIFQNVFDEKADGYAVDLGLNYILSKKLNIGIAYKNLGKMSELYQVETELPTSFEAGLYYKEIINISDGFINGGFVVQHISDSPKNQFLTKTGLEYSYQNRFFLRSGYITGSDLFNWSAGFGISHGPYLLDYGYKNASEGFGGIHLFSFHFQF